MTATQQADALIRTAARIEAQAHRSRDRKAALAKAGELRRQAINVLGAAGYRVSPRRQERLPYKD